MAYTKSTKQTQEIHRQIVTICKYLKTSYQSKRHGGYNIYKDDKIFICTDTYVPNVDCEVVLPDGTKEPVFSSAYGGLSGGLPSLYHTGKWETYLHKLWEKALMAKEKINVAKEKADNQKQRELDKPASKKAESVF